MRPSLSRKGGLLILLIISLSIGLAVLLSPGFRPNPGGDVDTVIVHVECIQCDAGPDGFEWRGVATDVKSAIPLRGRGAQNYTFVRGGEQFWLISISVQKEGVGGLLKVALTTPDGRVLKEASTSEPYGRIELAWPLQEAY